MLYVMGCAVGVAMTVLWGAGYPFLAVALPLLVLVYGAARVVWLEWP